MALLSQEQYLGTFGETRSRVSPDEGPPFDFWSYFDAIPPADFHNRNCSAGMVDYAWRDDAGRYEHVLVNSDDRNVFMVLVLDRLNATVYGHYLLDLNCEYGIHSADCQ
jgi:hypothetical protein